MVQKQFCSFVLTRRGKIVLFCPAMEMPSRDYKVHLEPGENKEEAAAEDGEENNEAGLCEQGTVRYLE